MAGGHVWQGACMVGKVCGGACIIGGMCGGVHAWCWKCVVGACMAGSCVLGGGMCERGSVHGRGCAWHAPSPLANTMIYGQWAGGTDLTGMHSCFLDNFNRVTFKFLQSKT